MAGPAGPAADDRMLLTPFQVPSRSGFPPYAGVVTYCWNSRAWRDSDAIIANLIVQHLIAVVDHERLMVAVARAEDQAASLALEAISARTINMATGIVMPPTTLRPSSGNRRNQLGRPSRRSWPASCIPGLSSPTLRMTTKPGPCARGRLRSA
jgi:hypothetical protein